MTYTFHRDELILKELSLDETDDMDWSVIFKAADLTKATKYQL